MRVYSAKLSPTRISTTISNESHGSVRLSKKSESHTKVRQEREVDKEGRTFLGARQMKDIL